MFRCNRLVRMIPAVAAVIALVQFAAPGAHAVDVPQLTKQTSTKARAASVVQPKFAPGAAFSKALSAGATGIYTLGTSTFTGYASATTFALVHQGQIREVHSKSGGQWMSKRSSQGGLGLTSAQFDDLIALAGGLDRNVNTTNGRDQFLCLAKLAAGCGSGAAPSTGTPGEVAPVGMRCPTGYQLQSTASGGRTCRLISYAVPPVANRFAALGLMLELLVPAAQANDCGPIGCLAYYSFGEISATQFKFEYNEQAGYWGFQGGGMWAIFDLTGG